MTGHKVRIYLYSDAAGRPRLRKVRKEPKSLLRQPFGMDSWKPSATHKDGGYWVPKLRDWQREFSESALYHLQELVWALSQDRPAYIGEGEKDCDILRAIGGSDIAATTAWQGASRFTDEQARWFTTGKGPVLIVVDVDEAGAYSGCLRYDALRRVGVDRSRLRIVAPPHPHNDVADALAVGALRADLKGFGLRRVFLSQLRPVAASYAVQRHARRGSSDWHSAS